MSRDMKLLRRRIHSVERVLKKSTLPADMRKFWEGVLKKLHPFAIEMDRYGPCGTDQ